MIARTAILTALACVLAATPLLAGGAPSDDLDIAAATADSTQLLVVYGSATTWDGRQLPSGLEIVVTNPTTGDTAVGVVGATARGMYEAVLFAVDHSVASVGDLLEFTIADAEFDPGNGIVAVTEEDLSAGMLRYDVAPDVISAAPGLPAAARLLGARPNPFNPRTMILLEQHREGPVELDLYDVRGLLVRRLFQGVLGVGSHEFPWNGLDEAGREMPSGIYLVSMHAGDFSALGKITLVR